MPRIPQRCRKSANADALGGKIAPEWSLGDPACHKLFKYWGTPVLDLFASSWAHKVPQYYQPGFLRQGSIWGRCLEGEVFKGPQVCFRTSKHHPNGPGQASKMRRGPDHDHILLTRSELVPRDHASGSRAGKKVQTITVAPMECHNPIPKVVKSISVGCLEAHITICAQSGIKEEITRKVNDSWTKGTK